MRKPENHRIDVYQELLKKIEKICVEEKDESTDRDSMGRCTSQTIPDLWQGFVPSSSSSSFQCPHCPHCKSQLSPHYPTSAPSTLLKSLESCEIDLKFINSIVWMKSMITAVKNVPITEVKKILKALSIIDAPANGDKDEDKSVLQTSSQLMKINYAKSEMEIEKNPKINQDLISRNRGTKRKSNEENWPPYNSNLNTIKGKKSMIPDTDEEASQRTPEISFSDNSQSPFMKFMGDSGIDHMGSLITKSIDDNDDERVDKNIEISSFKLSIILYEFPVNSVALSIVRMTFRALECSDTIQYCWRGGDVVINAVNIILKFIDTIAVEEHKFPGYLDFFVKSAVETIKKVYEGLEDGGHTILEKSHHLTAVLELCNCKIICEEIISYLCEELTTFKDNGRNSNAESTRINYIFYSLHLTLEKYYNILSSSVDEKSCNSLHNSPRSLFDKWSKKIDRSFHDNYHLFPTKMSFLRKIFLNLKELI